MRTLAPLRHFALLGALFCLAGCTIPAAGTEGDRGAALPMAYPPLPLPMPPPAAPKPPPMPVPPAQSAPVDAYWTFVSGSEACSAVADGGTVGLSIIVQKGQPVIVTYTTARSPFAAGTKLAIRLSGAAGRWTLPAEAMEGGGVEADVPAGHKALDAVLAVLGGGTAAVAGMPEIAMRPAGAAGAEWWFGCARQRAGM